MSFTVRVTCAKRTFPTGASHPPNGVTWALGVLTAPGVEQPAFAIADSANPRGITVTPDTTPSGDSVSVELTIPLDLTLLLGDLAVFGSSAKACALSLFGDGGFDASAPANDWWVARRVFPVVQQEGPSFIPASGPHVEIKVLAEATTVYLSGPSHGYQYNPVGSWSYNVTAWQWTFPDASTHSGQHVAFTHPEPATGQIDVIVLEMTMVPTDGSTGPIVVSGPIVDVITTNLLPVSFTTHNLFTVTVNDDAVTLADDGCYDPGYSVSANLHGTLGVLMSSTLPFGDIADWFWRLYHFEEGEVEDEVTNGHAAPAPATFTVEDMEPGGYAVRLTITDLWGGQTTSLREVFTIEAAGVASVLDLAGALYAAHRTGAVGNPLTGPHCLLTKRSAPNQAPVERPVQAWLQPAALALDAQHRLCLLARYQPDVAGPLSGMWFVSRSTDDGRSFFPLGTGANAPFDDSYQAAALAISLDGQFLAVARQANEDDTFTLWFRRSADGATWSAPVAVGTISRRFNPVVFQRSELQGTTILASDCDTRLFASEDYGATWSLHALDAEAGSQQVFENADGDVWKGAHLSGLMGGGLIAIARRQSEDAGRAGIWTRRGRSLDSSGTVFAWGDLAKVQATPENSLERLFQVWQRHAQNDTQLVACNAASAVRISNDAARNWSDAA